MWRWDQGRMGYFQYDVLKSVSSFVVEHGWSGNDSALIRSKTSQQFAAPQTHSAWRNYKRIFKLCLLLSEKDGMAVPTPVAQILAETGAVTCDEYLHFLIEATTDPSPALRDWKVASEGGIIRYPLCFVLKYLLTKVTQNDPVAGIYELIGAYVESNFSGVEDDVAFLSLMGKSETYEKIGKNKDSRQARESIKFITQISYLYSDGSNIIASLNPEDAMNIFQDIHPISGPCETDGNLEIQRLAALFADGSNHDFFEYKDSVVSDLRESGFSEGSKVKKTHIVIERNSKLRDLFFAQKPTTVCDACSLDTKKKYPWVERTLDLHHILPLCSGTRVDSKTGTLLDDLMPVCPTCHHAIHRFYDNHLRIAMRQDFLDSQEAREIYTQAKQNIIKGDCYV